MRLARRLADWLPGRARLRDRLVGASFILTPQRQPQRLAQPIGALDQLFFWVASGSVTVATPRFRSRRAVPVWHQLRLRW